MSFREKLNQLGFSWELPTHTKRKRKGDEDAVERGEDATVPVANTEEESNSVKQKLGTDKYG